MKKRTTKNGDLSEKLLRPLGEIASVLGDAFSDRMAERLGGMLPDFESLGKKTSYELEAIRDQVGALTVGAELLENANRTNRLLGEQFYEERIIGPMVRGLFPIMDLVCDAMRRSDSDLQCLSGLRAQMEQFLAGYRIDAFSHEARSPFDPKIMKPLQTDVTCEFDLDGLVAKSLQCGFRNPERIWRLETVSLYKFEKPLTKPSAQIERSQS